MTSRCTNGVPYGSRVPERGCTIKSFFSVAVESLLEVRGKNHLFFQPPGNAVMVLQVQITNSYMC